MRLCRRYGCKSSSFSSADSRLQAEAGGRFSAPSQDESAKSDSQSLALSPSQPVLALHCTARFEDQGGRHSMNGEPTRGAKRQARKLQWRVSGLCLWARAISRHSSNASHVMICSAKIVLKTPIALGPTHSRICPFRYTIWRGDACPPLPSIPRQVRGSRWEAFDEWRAYARREATSPKSAMVSFGLVPVGTFRRACPFSRKVHISDLLHGSEEPVPFSLFTRSEEPVPTGT